MPESRRLTWPQLLLAVAAVVGIANAFRQAVLATAPVSPRLAMLSGLQAVAAAGALYAVRARPRWATGMALAWAIGLLVAVVGGTELLPARALAPLERLPGCLAALAYAALVVRGVRREAARRASATGAGGRVPSPAA